jgi:hypothetical protein
LEWIWIDFRADFDLTSLEHSKLWSKKGRQKMPKSGQRHPALNNVSCAVLWGEEKVAGLVQAYDLLGRITL